LKRLGEGELSVLANHRSSTRLRRWAVVALPVALTAAAALALPAGAGAHSERTSFFPDPNATNCVGGSCDFPVYRTTGPQLVVCARDSRQRIQQTETGSLRRKNLKLIKQCHYRSIQDAVNAASNGYRIAILPGVYTEPNSLREPHPDPNCSTPGVYWTENPEGDSVPTYQYQHDCPNAQNLIAIAGDTNGDRICDSKCNLQIEGTGSSPSDVVIEGDRFSGPTQKLNGIRADRADGIYLRNFEVEYFDFNGVYFLETNGFRLDNVLSRWSREYGVLSFASDHGIYENCEAYGNGDSGVYPGSGPNARHGMPDIYGHVYGIEIRNCDSHDNLMGSSATAGNGTWYHNNSFHHNAAGSVTDALVSGHPGMPPDFSKFSNNLYYSNNKNLFSNGPIPPGEYTDDTQTGRDEYCKQPPDQRDLRVVCPSFMMPVGSGTVLAGTNSDIVEGNYYFDNWRLGTLLLYVPSTVRGENDPSRQNDTSSNNRQLGNCMGVRPPVLNPGQVNFSTCSGTHDPNGSPDFWWDEEEGADCPEVGWDGVADQQPGPCVDASDSLGNCWAQTGTTPNKAFAGAQPSTDPLVVPDCPGIDVARPSNASKSGLLIPCVTWDPQANTDPPGCETPAGKSWFDVPPEPQP
jgi:parallel beta helix pectate lyase-like protein